MKLETKFIFQTKLINLLLVFVITIAIITFSIGTEYINYFYKNEVDKANMQKYSSKIKIEFKSEVDSNIYLDFLLESKMPVISIETPILENNKRIFISGSSANINSNIIPSYKGNYFTVEDIKNNSNIAMVGYAHRDLVYTKNGDEYICIQGKELKVWGYVGRDTNSYWNGCVIVPINTYREFIGAKSSSEYEYIATNKSDTQEEISRVGEYFGSLYNIAYGNDNYLIKDIGSIVYQEKKKVFILALLIIAALINIINLSYSWFKKNRRALAVLCVTGYSKKYIIRILLTTFGIISLLSLLISSIILRFLETYLFNIFYVYMKFKIENLMLAMLFSLGILLYICYVNYWQLIKGNFINDIRGKN